MQVNVQKLSPVLVEFAVEIPVDRVRQEVERAYGELARTARIRGYRPGKAPREVLSHVYGGKVTSDVAQRLVDQTLPAALAQKSVQPLITLSISPSKLSLAEPFSYRARFEVTPDIETVNFEGFQLKRPATTATDEMVEKDLEELRNEHAVLRAPEPARPAQQGDTVVIDFTLELDGKLVPDAASTGVETELGSGKLLKELDDALLGANVGDQRDANVPFAGGHPRPDFRNKTGVFHVTVKEIKERILPALDDDFAKDVGTFDTLAALKDDLKKKVETRLTQQAEDTMAQQMVVELCKANPIPVPPSLVRKQAELTEQEIAQRARQQGQRMQMTDELRGQVQQDAEIKVRAGLLMAAIAKSKEVKITDEDIEKAYGELAEQTGKNVARLKAEYRDQRKREYLMGMILEDKILDIIQEKAVVSDEA